MSRSAGDDLLAALGAEDSGDSSSKKGVNGLPTSVSPPPAVKSAVSFSDLETGGAEDRATDIEEVTIPTAEVQDASRTSLDFLAALLMPLVYEFGFPPVFQNVWQWLLQHVNKPRSFPQLALGLPRGFGKTTLIKIFIVYCILFTSKKFILITAATASMAENILADIADMLDEPNIKKVFGDWRIGIERDTNSLKKFGYRGRNITLATVGAGGSLRGLNIKNARPDVMIFEDIQSRECADSEVQSNALESWMVGTAMKAKSPHGCMFLFVGNMYPTKHSILRKLKYNPKWFKFIAGGILAEGTSLWEDLQPIDQLMAEFENDLSMGRPEIFYSEVLNDENAAANNLIDLSKLPLVPYQEGDIAAGNFIVIDPATDKLGADEISIGYCEIHDGAPILMKIEEGRFSPSETIRKALHFALTYNCRLIAVEANAYQYSLLHWFDQVCLQLGIQGIEAVPVYSGRSSKNARILEMFKAYLQGELYVHEDAKTAVHLQISSFNALRRDNTDGLLDLLTYMNKIVELYAEFVIASNIIETQEFDASEVIENNSCF